MVLQRIEVELMAANVREQILSVTELDYEEIDIPEWGGRFRVRVMTGTERDQLEAAQLAAPLVGATGERTPAKNWRAMFVVLTLCDLDGQRVFADNDIEKVGGLSSKVLHRVAEVSLRVNDLTNEAVEDAVKN